MEDYIFKKSRNFKDTLRSRGQVFDLFLQKICIFQKMFVPLRCNYKTKIISLCQESQENLAARGYITSCCVASIDRIFSRKTKIIEPSSE